MPIYAGTEKQGEDKVDSISALVTSTICFLYGSCFCLLNSPCEMLFLGFLFLYCEFYSVIKLTRGPQTHVNSGKTQRLPTFTPRTHQSDLNFKCLQEYSLLRCQRVLMINVILVSRFSCLETDVE